MGSRGLKIFVAVVAFGMGLSIATDAAVKTLNPMPVMVLTGYSESDKFKRPSCLFVDRKRGDIWVADAGNHQIVEFDSQGSPILRFRHMSVDHETGEATPGTPQSVAVDSSGQVFVTDAASDRIAMYDYRGRLIKRIDVAKLIGVERARIGWLRIDANDNLYLVDVDGLRLVVLNATQGLVRTVGLKRAAKTSSTGVAHDNTSDSVCSMDIGSDGRIYLLNADDSPCVRSLDPTGKELMAFGDIDTGWDNFVRPSAIVSIDDGTFWVADAGSNITKQYGQDGKYEQYIGGGPGTRPGEMRFPVALATDGKDKLYVAEQGTNRVQVFSLR